MCSWLRSQPPPNLPLNKGEEPATRSWVRWLAISASALVFIPATGWFVRQLIYPAPPFAVPSPPPLPIKEVILSLSSRQSISAWLLEASDSSPTTPVIVYFHGNGENLQTMQLAGLYDEFHSLKVHFLAIDYPGYGRSEGKPSEAHNLEAASAAFQWIRQKYPQNPVIVCGWSLGAGVAIQTAAKHADRSCRRTSCKTKHIQRRNCALSDCKKNRKRRYG